MKSDEEQAPDAATVTPAALPGILEAGSGSDLAWRAVCSAKSLHALQAEREGIEAQGKAVIQKMREVLAERLKQLDRQAEGEEENLRFLLAERRQREGKTLKLLTDQGDWAEVQFRAWPTQGERDGKRWRITGWDEKQVILNAPGDSNVAYTQEKWHASKEEALKWFLQTGEIIPGVQIEEDTRPDRVSVSIERKELNP